MNNIITCYWFGYDGKILTKEEYDKRVAEALAEAERDRLWLLEHPEDNYW